MKEQEGSLETLSFEVNTSCEKGELYGLSEERGRSQQREQ